MAQERLHASEDIETMKSGVPSEFCASGGEINWYDEPLTRANQLTISAEHVLDQKTDIRCETLFLNL